MTFSHYLVNQRSCLLVKWPPALLQSAIPPSMSSSLSVVAMAQHSLLSLKTSSKNPLLPTNQTTLSVCLVAGTILLLRIVLLNCTSSKSFLFPNNLTVICQYAYTILVITGPYILSAYKLLSNYLQTTKLYSKPNN